MQRVVFNLNYCDMFSVHAADGQARCGVLTAASGAIIDTPALLVHTQRGGALHLTPDLLQTLRPELQGLQLDALQL